MPIVAAELIAFAALLRPEDDTASSGGGQDIDNRPSFVQMAADGTVEMLSSAPGDTTQGVTVTGRDAAGAIISDTQTMNGTTIVVFTGTFERVLKVLMDADATGIITVQRTTGPTLIATIPIGDRGFTALFIDSASEAGAVERFEKIFWENTHGTLTLTNAKVQLTADPASRIRLGIETTKDDTVSVANRKILPSNPTFVDDSVQQDVPTGNLAAGEAIGTWLEQGLLASDAPIRSTFTTELAGTST